MGAIQLKTGYLSEYDVNPEEEKTAIWKAFGSKDEVIAKYKCRSKDTIKSQVKSVYDKVGVNNSSELLIKLIEKAYGISIDIKDFISENSREIASILLLCIYLSGHFNCDIRRPRRLQSRRQETELIYEEV